MCNLYMYFLGVYFGILDQVNEYASNIVSHYIRKETCIPVGGPFWVQDLHHILYNLYTIDYIHKPPQTNV